MAPALEKYVKGPLADLWKRAELSPRDRSIVTVAALIARNQTIEMPHYFSLALDNGLNRVRFPKSSRILLFIPAGPMQRRQSLQLRMFSPHAR